MRLSLRAGALLAAGSLAVHELRYVAAYGGPGPVSGHGYLAIVVPLVALAFAVACGTWVARVGRVAAPVPRGPRTWAAASAVLVAIFLLQESAEAFAAGGHPGLFAHGGWLALPLAVAIGGLIALALCGARAADIAARSSAPLAAVAAAAPMDFSLPVSAPAQPRPRVLARRLAGRAPPIGS